MNTKHCLFFHLVSSTTSLAIKTLWKRILSPKNGLCLLSLILERTFFILLAKTSATILYIHLTKEIGLNSSRPYGFSTLGIKVMKYGLHSFERIPFVWNSLKNLKISFFKVDQKALLKIEVIQPYTLLVPTLPNCFFHFLLLKHAIQHTILLL